LRTPSVPVVVSSYGHRNGRQLIHGMLREQNTPTPRLGLLPRTQRTLVLVIWAILICCIVMGSLSSAASPVMVDIGRLHINDKVMHFCAYLALSLLHVVGFKDRRRGLLAGLSMFILGILMEAGQHFSPGRAVELGDVIANGVGVSCGVLCAFLILAIERRVLH
jgi:hypothetical protein